MPSAPPHGDHGPRAGEKAAPQGVPRSCARPPSHLYLEVDPEDKISQRGASARWFPANAATRRAPNQARRTDPARSRQERNAPPRELAGGPPRSRSRGDSQRGRENRLDISRHPSPRAYRQTPKISLFLVSPQSHQVVCPRELLAEPGPFSLGVRRGQARPWTYM
jgi:hypothetical protein